MDAPAPWDEPGKEAFRINAIAEIKKSGGTISDSASYEEVRRYQAGFRDPVVSAAAPAAVNARRSASDAHSEDEQRKQVKKKLRQ